MSFKAAGGGCNGRADKPWADGRNARTYFSLPDLPEGSGTVDWRTYGVRVARARSQVWHATMGRARRLQRRAGVCALLCEPSRFLVVGARLLDGASQSGVCAGFGEGSSRLRGR